MGADSERRLCCAADGSGAVGEFRAGLEASAGGSGAAPIGSGREGACKRLLTCVVEDRGAVGCRGVLAGKASGAAANWTGGVGANAAMGVAGSDRGGNAAGVMTDGRGLATAGSGRAWVGVAGTRLDGASGDSDRAKIA